MQDSNTIHWNPSIKLVFSDVDETIADVYTRAEPAMIKELSALLEEGRKLCMVTGGGISRVQAGITEHVEPRLRKNMLVSHCSGAEVWGFQENGNLLPRPFYSRYEDIFTPDMKQRWRSIMIQLVAEFDLNPNQAMPKKKFWDRVGYDPHDIMLDDRGPQITMELVNSTMLTPEQRATFTQTIPEVNGIYDLRYAIQSRAQELLRTEGIPVEPHFGGNFAIDFAIAGVSKTQSIKTIIGDPQILGAIGLTWDAIQEPEHLEIWGDKFSRVNGGTDRHMSLAVSPQVRSIDFRKEDPAELPQDINLVLWNGEQHLHHGLLEYLRSRHN